MNEAQSVNELLEPVITGMGYECVGIEFKIQSHHGVLRVYIDKEQGISVDDCTQVSRQLSAVLDVEEPISIAYDLEVSSPGLERPLFKSADYEKFMGRKCKVRTRQGDVVTGRRNYAGTIKQVDGDSVIIEVDGEAFSIAVSNVDRAHLVYED